ncbi:MAG TPA: hypothetical protein VHB51_01805 [Candidatus Saccharimonadales bacterium]|nr:hypothetical protein [Candidatus Saccharimonadales bacterium]
MSATATEAPFFDGQIHNHPYLSGSDTVSVRTLGSTSTLEWVIKTNKEVLTDHNHNPYDVLVGDDVSGRLPTLITHHFLRLAQAGGHTETMPHTYFLTSGMTRDYSDEQVALWKHNLGMAARAIVAANHASRIAIMTETVSSGRSMARLVESFDSQRGVTAHAYNMQSATYLGGPGDDNRTRVALGVEKYIPEPFSRRHPSFSGEKASRLRHFLADYAAVIYQDIFNEPAPTGRTRQPSAPITPLRTPDIKRLGGLQRLFRWRSDKGIYRSR